MPASGFAYGKGPTVEDVYWVSMYFPTRTCSNRRQLQVCRLVDIHG